MNKDRQIKELLSEIEAKDAEINRLNLVQYQILNSKTWKYVNLIRKIVTVIKKPSLILVKLGWKRKENDVSYFTACNSEYQENIDFTGRKTDIKAIAIYLPQFHTFKENDEWWGKGFTEWTNTKKSLPRFKNHYQPREPHEDIGYYDLSDFNALKKQIELAKQHGIYGFSFYYYWFSGKRLMEKPVDALLEHPEIDFPFCLCWANENWTRTWDGQENKVLIKQEYSKEDPKKFISDIKKYVMDKRYIRIDNKPVIMVYNPNAIPNVDTVIKKWKEEAIKQGIGEIYVITRNLILDNQEEVKNCDAEYDFVPLQKGFPSSIMSGVKQGTVYNYEIVVNEMINLYNRHISKKPFYYTSMMAWDNSSRRNEGFHTFHHYSLESFYRWNREIIENVRNSYPIDKRFMFVNAWNEWCEGVYLDPDKKYGYANINTLSKALFDIPFKKLNIINEGSDIKLNNQKIAIQIHLFHEDVTEEIIKQLNHIPFDFDCYITTDTNEKKEKIAEKFKNLSKAKKVQIDIAKNRGRDVAPFILQFSKVYKNYDYICHIHTKKSKTTEYGDDWRKYLYNNLFGSRKNISKIFEMFETDKNLGLIYPSIYPVIVDQTMHYGNNYENCFKQLKRLNIPESFINDKLEFPAGTMFWAKVDAIKPIFETHYKLTDFAKEAGQLDATLAHAIERTFCNLARSRSYTFQNTYNNTIEYIPLKKKRIVLFAHYDKIGNISEEDKRYLKALKNYSNKIVFITNDKVISKHDHIENVDMIIENNVGYDFGAWKKAILTLGEREFEKYDEVIFANNSRFLTNISFDEFFSTSKKNTIKALCFHSKENKIDYDYVQSDFMVLPTEVLCKKEILSFFTTCEDCKTIEEKKSKCNYEFTKELKKNKINIDIFINETKYINKYLINSPMDLKSPYLMLLLKSPLLNKKSLYFINDYEKIKINDFIKQCK